MPNRQSPGWPRRFGGEDRRLGPQGAAGEDDVRRQPLEQVRLLARSVVMPVLDLAVGPGQLEGARRGAGLAELVGQGQRLVAATRRRR